MTVPESHFVPIMLSLFALDKSICQMININVFFFTGVVEHSIMHTDNAFAVTHSAGKCS